MSTFVYFLERYPYMSTFVYFCLLLFTFVFTFILDLANPLEYFENLLKVVC
jgi:hypothetical protein